MSDFESIASSASEALSRLPDLAKQLTWKTADPLPVPVAGGSVEAYEGRLGRTYVFTAEYTDRGVKGCTAVLCSGVAGEPAIINVPYALAKVVFDTAKAMFSKVNEH